MKQLVDTRVGLIPEQKLFLEYSSGAKKNKEKTRRAPDVLLLADCELNSAIAADLSDFFRVHSVSNGREPWNMVRKILPDMVLVEAGMPGIKVKEFGRLLRNNPVTSHIPLLFITGKNPSLDDVSLFSLGAIDCIHWPFDVTLIKMKLYNILENNARVQKRAGILQFMGANNIDLSTSDEDFLEDVVSVIDSHIDNPCLDVEQLSEPLLMTPNRIYRKIKRLTGYTAKKFISIHRLKTAAYYIVYRNSNVSEVAYMVGFSSPSYFSKCFKDHFGCTPKEYIEKAEL